MYSNNSKNKLKRSTGLLNLSLNEDIASSNEEINTKTIPQKRGSNKRAYSISPSLSNSSDSVGSSSKNSAFKFSYSQFRRVNSDIYSNNIENDVKNWSPFKDYDQPKKKQVKRSIFDPITTSRSDTDHNGSAGSSSKRSSIFSTIRKVSASNDKAQLAEVEKNEFNNDSINESTIKLVPEVPKSDFKFTFKKENIKPNDTEKGTHIFNHKNLENIDKNNNNRNNSTMSTRSRRGTIGSSTATSTKSTGSSYKFVKPLQTAFMSTGLMSKKNNVRNNSLSVPESPFLNNKNSKYYFNTKPVPETPCKPITPLKTNLIMSVEKPRSRLSTYVAYNNDAEILPTGPGKLILKSDNKLPSSSAILDIDVDLDYDKSMELDFSSGKKSNSDSSRMDIEYDSPCSIDKLISPKTNPLKKTNLKETLKRYKNATPLNDTPLNLKTNNLNILTDTQQNHLFNFSMNASDDSIHNSRSRTFKKTKHQNADTGTKLDFYDSKETNSSASLVRSPNFKSINSLSDITRNSLKNSPKLGKAKETSLTSNNNLNKYFKPIYDFDDDEYDDWLKSDDYYSTTPTKASFSHTKTAAAQELELKQNILNKTFAKEGFYSVGNSHTPNTSGINLNETKFNTPHKFFEEEFEPTLQSEPVLDDFLHSKLGNNFKLTGEGEFSLVFECDYKHSKYAIKRTKKTVKLPSVKKFQNHRESALQFNTKIDKEFIEMLIGERTDLINFNPTEEIEIMNGLKKNSRKFTGSEYLVNYVSNFSVNSYNYIVSEFCENGPLDKFLIKHSDQRLDEFRVWKILVEILLGLNFLHENGILHLDLKPANIFINFEGSLKIGDFGMSTKLENLDKSVGLNRPKIFAQRNIMTSAAKTTTTTIKSIDKEGDREYIAPEILLKSEYGPAADIFSLGLIIVEIAANIYLPDNGVSWQKLRSGDLSDAGRLSFCDLAKEGSVPKSQSQPLPEPRSRHHVASSSIASASTTSNTLLTKTFSTDTAATNMLSVPENEMINPVSASSADTFLRDGKTLDLVVHWMIEPEPSERPSAGDLINLYELQYIELKRKAGAVIYEGDSGPEINMDDSVELDDDMAFNHETFDEEIGNNERTSNTVGEYLSGFLSVRSVYKGE